MLQRYTPPRVSSSNPRDRTRNCRVVAARLIASRLLSKYSAFETLLDRSFTSRKLTVFAKLCLIFYEKKKQDREEASMHEIGNHN